ELMATCCSSIQRSIFQKGSSWPDAWDKSLKKISIKSDTDSLYITYLETVSTVEMSVPNKIRSRVTLSDTPSGSNRTWLLEPLEALWVALRLICHQRTDRKDPYLNNTGYIKP